MIPDDGLQLEEALEGVLVERELLVAQAQVVEGLHARSVVLQRHVVQLASLLHVALLEGAIGCKKYHYNLISNPFISAFQLQFLINLQG